MGQPRETAGTTMRLVVDHVRRTGGDEAVQAMLLAAGEARPLAMLEDEGVWSSYDAKIALFEAAALVTGQPDVARRVGEGALASSVGGSIKLLIGLVGSPAQVARGIARANSKFTTAAEMAALSTEPTSAVVRYRLLDHYTPSAHDCGYTAGLLSQIPVLFGLPAARVRHDVCQVRGADACLYHLSWQRPRARWRRGSGRREAAEGSRSGVLQRLTDLQETVAELVADRSLDEVLEVVTMRARSTVGAQRFLLVAQVDDTPPRVQADGFTIEDAERVAAQLLDDTVPDFGEHVIVAEVRSARRDYGRLAAFGRAPFFEHEGDLLRSYAALAASALDTVTALEEARDQRRVDEVLLGFARTLLRTRDRAEVAAATAEAARSIAAADSAAVMLLDPADGVMRMAATSGWSTEEEVTLREMVVRPEDTPELDALRQRPDAPRSYGRSTSDPFIRGALETFDRARLVVMPLWSSSRLWGIVVATWQDEVGSPSHGQLLGRLTGVADQAVTALDRAELAETVHQQATVDTLTGLANRREFTDRLQRALAGGAEAPRPAVIFLDLDRFKEVNDGWGHAAGDELLCAVGRRLRSLVRADDVVARLGGDEFTVLLSGVRDRSDVEDFATRVRDALAESFSFEGQAFVTPPSIGGVVVSREHRTVRDVLRDADAAMYAAKKAGGNRFVVLDEVSAGEPADV